jgi:hypothetical protein
LVLSAAKLLRSGEGAIGVTDDTGARPAGNRVEERVLAILGAPASDRPALLRGLERDVPDGLSTLAQVATREPSLADEALGLFASAAERLTPEDVDALLGTEDGPELRALLLAIGATRCDDVIDILEMRIPDVVAQYMMHVDWADDEALLDLVEVLASLRTAMALWSLDGMAQRFPGLVGDRARQALEEVD